MVYKKISKKKFLQALEGSYGILSVVAQRLGVSRQAVYKFFQRYPEMREELEKEREKIIDRAEAVLFKKVSEEDWKAVEFVLKTLGKNRGYYDKHIVEAQQNLTIDSIEDEIKKLLDKD